MPAKTSETTSSAKAVLAVGTLWEVPEGASVIRPDGQVATVVGGVHCLSVPGVYKCGRQRVTAGDPE